MPVPKQLRPDGGRDMRWWHRLGVRARLVTLGAIGVALALGVGGVGLSSLLRYTVDRSVDNEARQTAQGIAEMVDAGTLPEPLPVAGGTFVQIVDARHRVLVASTNADRLVPLLRESELPGAKGGRHLVVDAERFGQSGRLWVVAVGVGAVGVGAVGVGTVGAGTVGVGAAAPDRTVLVAKSMVDYDGSVTMLDQLLLAAYPVFLVVLTVLGWRVAGAALRPVEAIRARAAEITGAEGTERLPVPVAADELRNLAVTLNDLLDRLERSRARQRVFVADAAHELRSPLANMRTQLEVAGHLGESTELLDDLLVDVVRMSGLVDDLLLLARIDAAAAVSPAPVDLAQVCTEVADRYRGARVPVDATFETALPVLAERGALARVVTNLVDNAIRHAAHGVSLSGSVRCGYCEITVVDDGPGIPAADRQRVFDRFTRLDDARARDSGGSGLGLAIVRELVTGFGGTIELGEGCAVQGEEGAGLSGPGLGGPGLSGPGLRVLVRLPAIDPASESE